MAAKTAEGIAAAEADESYKIQELKLGRIPLLSSCSLLPAGYETACREGFLAEISKFPRFKEKFKKVIFFT